ncbi:Enkurin domain-containing protein 1 [Podochytrium sp. JEL0797]|nr:Enkurin domain-containing protein 1 [Podochytrium sp. JEL0797]
MEWAEREKERLDALKKECIPKGMKLLPDEERLETLGFLEDTRVKLLNELSHFALVVESAKLKNKRAMLENKLTEIEEAIGVFSRRKVYVNEEEQ